MGWRFFKIFDKQGGLRKKFYIEGGWQEGGWKWHFFKRQGGFCKKKLSVAFSKKISPISLIYFIFRLYRLLKFYKKIERVKQNNFILVLYTFVKAGRCWNEKQEEYFFGGLAEGDGAWKIFKNLRVLTWHDKQGWGILNSAFHYNKVL